MRNATLIEKPFAEAVVDPNDFKKHFKSLLDSED
jgi:hypothetical protein